MMLRDKGATLPDWYDLANDVLDAFAPAVDELKAPLNEDSSIRRESLIQQRFYSLFSAFSRECSYFYPHELTFSTAPVEGAVAKGLHRIAKACDHIAIHFWDPITGERRRILNHHLGPLDTLLVTDDFRRWFKTIDKVYADLTYQMGEGKTTFVQSIARAALNRGRPIQLILCSPDEVSCIPKPHRHKVVEFPFKEMDRLFDQIGVNAAIASLRSGDSANGITRLLTDMPAHFQEIPACIKCGNDLYKVSGDQQLSDPCHLWPILAGLYFWHQTGYPLFPYILSLVPIRFPSRSAEGRRGIFFALSAHLAGESATTAPPASVQNGIDDAINGLQRLAEGIASGLQSLTVSFNEVFYSRWYASYVFEHELGNALNGLAEWGYAAETSREHVDLWGYVSRTVDFMNDYRKYIRAFGDIASIRLEGEKLQLIGDSLSRLWSWPDLIRDVTYAVTDPSTKRERLIQYNWDFGADHVISFHSCRTDADALDFCADWPRPDASYMSLRAILTNLIRNAIEHRLNSPVAIEIQLHRPDFVEFVVIDSGKPFCPAPNEATARQFRGLGLRIVDAILRALAQVSPKHTVVFEKPDVGQSEGKRFRVGLPLSKETRGQP